MQKNEIKTWPDKAEEIPDCIDQLAAQVRDLIGKGETFRGLVKLTGIAAKEIEDMPSTTDTEEYRAAHAGRLRFEARAINKEFQR